MPPQQESLPVPRGRTQATKPLSGRSTRKAHVSPASVDKQPAGAAASATAATATRHAQNPGQVSDDAAKPKSPPLQATLTKEHLKGLPPTKETSNPPSSDNGEDSSPQPVELALEPIDSIHPISQPKLEPLISPEPLQATAQALPKVPSPPPIEETPVQSTPPEPTDSILISQPQPEPATGFPIPPPEPLQITAQSYPWLYMSSTLEACFIDVETPTKKEHHESEIKGDILLKGENTQSDTERTIEFCDDLTSDTFIKEAPAMMQSFMTFSEVSERVEAEALQLATNTPSLESEEPLGVYNAMMDKLSHLLQQAEGIQSAIQRLTRTTAVSEDEVRSSSSETDGDHGTDGEQAQRREPRTETDSARAQMLGLFQACLPVLGARIANLSMAQELIDSAQENFSLALRMEDMGVD